MEPTGQVKDGGFALGNFAATNTGRIEARSSLEASREGRGDETQVVAPGGVRQERPTPEGSVEQRLKSGELTASNSRKNIGNETLAFSHAGLGSLPTGPYVPTG